MRVVVLRLGKAVIAKLVDDVNCAPDVAAKSPPKSYHPATQLELTKLLSKSTAVIVTFTAVVVEPFKVIPRCIDFIGLDDPSTAISIAPSSRWPHRHRLVEWNAR